MKLVEYNFFIGSFGFNPISKDSNWLNAAAVPITMKNNILKNTNEDFFPHENNNNNNYLSSENEFNEDEISNRQYNLTPMNPIENHYVNHNNNFSNDINTNNINTTNNNNNSNSYYDEMQKSKILFIFLIFYYRFIKYKK